MTAHGHHTWGMSDTAATDTRPGLSPRMRTAIASVLVVGALAGLFFTARAAVTGDNSTSLALPDSVDRLIPDSGDEVLAQSAVGVDLATGFDAYLIVNGTEIRTEADGLTKDLGLGLVTFQPGESTPIGSLLPEKNCVIAMVWAQSDGEEAAEPVNWCFGAA